MLCRALLRGRTWPDALALAAEDRLPETRDALTGDGELSGSGFSPDALRAAIHFVGTSDSLPAALERSIAFAGPANYCPVLVGSIGGARWGADSVPATLLEASPGTVLTRLIFRRRHAGACLARRRLTSDTSLR